MKKFMDSLDKTPTTRLLDNSSRSSTASHGLNYQSSYPSPSGAANGDCVSADGRASPAASLRSENGDGKKPPKNGSAKTASVDQEESSKGKFHRIRDMSTDGRPRSLCTLSCCGRGRLSIVWLGGSSTVPGSPCSNGGDNVRIQSGLRKAPSTESDGLAMTSSTQLNSSASMFAVNDRQPACSDDPEVNSEKLGRIQFSISYDFPEMTLTLRIIRAVELPAKDFSGTSDPYVKIMLLPDKKRKLTTNVKRKNLNPRWNEVFAFEGFPYPKLMNKTLYMQVLDYDRFSRDDPIGEVCIPLSDFDLTSGQTLWKNLQPCKSHMGKLGELYLGLCYHPTNGQLTVNVQKARELKAKDINGLSDPYVKIWLMFDGKKTEKKKTTTMEKTLNPVYNESFAFEVQYEKIRQTSLMISVMDYDRMGRNEQIGQILLGSKSGPMEVKHWNEMFSKARQEVFHWHILKDFG